MASIYIFEWWLGCGESSSYFQVSESFQCGNSARSVICHIYIYHICHIYIYTCIQYTCTVYVPYIGDIFMMFPLVKSPYLHPFPSWTLRKQLCHYESSKGHLSALDGMRALALLWVFSLHSLLVETWDVETQKRREIPVPWSAVTWGSMDLWIKSGWKTWVIYDEFLLGFNGPEWDLLNGI